VVLQENAVNIFNSILERRSFFRSFVWHEINCLCSPLLSTLLCPTIALVFSYHTPEGELFLILLFVSTYEGDLLVGPLFAFAHFCAL